MVDMVQLLSVIQLSLLTILVILVAILFIQRRNEIEEIDRFKSNISNYIENIMNKLENQIKNLDEKQKNIQNDLFRLQREGLKYSINTIQLDNITRDNLIKSLKDLIARITCRTLAQKLEAYLTDLKDYLTSQLQSLQTQLEGLDTKISGAYESINSISKTIDSFKLQEAKQVLDSLAKLGVDVKATRSSLDELRALVKDTHYAIGKVDEIDGSLNELKDSFSQLQQTLQQLAAGINDASNVVSNVKNYIAEIERELASTQKGIAAKLACLYTLSMFSQALSDGFYISQYIVPALGSEVLDKAKAAWSSVYQGSCSGDYTCLARKLVLLPIMEKLGADGSSVLNEVYQAVTGMVASLRGRSPPSDSSDLYRLLLEAYKQCAAASSDGPGPSMLGYDSGNTMNFPS